MLSIYKIWAAATTQKQWTQQLEDYIMSKKPSTHQELETIIQEYFDKQK
jgi:hypothetical protein